MSSYIKLAGMLTLCLAIPPLGWYVMYKISPFDKKTNVLIAVACTIFFVYAQISAGNIDDILGKGNGFEVRMTSEDFRKKFNTAARKLAPNLNIEIAEQFKVDGKIFSHEFTPKLKLEGTIGDDEKINELKIFAAPVNKDESFRTINVLGLLIATLNPELDVDDRSEVLRDLRMLKNVATEEDYDWTTNRGKVKYSVHAKDGKVTFTSTLAD